MEIFEYYSSGIDAIANAVLTVDETEIERLSSRLEACSGCSTFGSAC